MNRVCALIILYNGRELSETAAESIVYKMQNVGLIDKPADATIVYKDADAIAKAIIAQEEHGEKHNNAATTLHFVVPEGKKTHAIRFLKEEFNLGAAKAKEAADTGCIVVENPNYDRILKGFCKIGIRAIGLDDNILLQQAVIYINERYPKAYLDKDFLSTLIPDVIKAKNQNDDFSLALIESVKLIANASCNECSDLGLNTITYNRICTAYNILASM